MLFWRLRRYYFTLCHGRIQRERGQGSGPPPPLKNHKNIGFPSNLDLDPLKITKLPRQHSTVGHYRHASKTPFQWRFAGGPMMPIFRGISILSPSPQKKKKKHTHTHKKKKKTLSVLDPLWQNFRDPPHAMLLFCHNKMYVLYLWGIRFWDTFWRWRSKDAILAPIIRTELLQGNQIRIHSGSFNNAEQFSQNLPYVYFECIVAERPLDF